MPGPTLEAFRDSLSASAPPADMPAPLTALWWAGRKDWQRAHAIVQDAGGTDAAWVHAYLHRVEGDLGNAAYWYRRSGHLVESGDLAAEWAAISQALLGA